MRIQVLAVCRNCDATDDDTGVYIRDAGFEEGDIFRFMGAASLPDGWTRREGNEWCKDCSEGKKKRPPTKRKRAE